MQQDAEILKQHQMELEYLYNKNQTVPRIRWEFTEDKEHGFVEHFAKHGIPIKFGFDVLTQIALHKRCNLPTMVGLLNHHFNDNQKTTDMLLKCVMADLLDWVDQLKMFVVIINYTQDVQDDIDRYQYPLPMVIEPKEVRKNIDSGYLLGCGSVILRDNHHDEDICLDHINRVNKMRFTISSNVALMIKNKWRNLDKCKEGETKEDFAKRKKAFDKYDRTAKDVMKTLTRYSHDFYLTHKYDKRGRVYCQGYHINYQGTAWNKAVIHLADEEIINDN